MSEFEDAATTVARLLRTNLRVIKDEISLASVNVSGEWQNADALKGYDGQITVGVSECVDQKLDLTGSLRRRTSYLKVNVWSTDTSAGVNGRIINSKIVQEVNRVVNQYCRSPNVTVYDLTNFGLSQTCKAFQGNGEYAPSSSQWTELSDTQNQQLWYSDDVRCQISKTASGEYAALLFKFKVESKKTVVKSLSLSFEGYGVAPGGNGVTVKVWNTTQAAWVNTQTISAGAEDQTVVLTLTANVSDYIDDEGYVWFLARTSNASNGSSPATLFCDYASCTVTVNAITYCDIASYRSLDRVDVKPFIYRTELSLKSWFFMNNGV
jgi:hypothetical protein